MLVPERTLPVFRRIAHFLLPSRNVEPHGGGYDIFRATGES